MRIDRGSNKLVGVDGGDFERDEVRADGINFQKLKTQNVAGTIEYDFGPVTLYSITSYWHGKLKSRGDIDGGFGSRPARTGPGFIPFPAQSQDDVPSLDQFTQEVRIASNNNGGPRLPGRRLLLRRESRHPDASTSARPTDDQPERRSSTSARTARRSASSVRSITSSTTA